MVTSTAQYGTLVLRLFFGLAFVIAGLDKILSFAVVKGMFDQLFGGMGSFMVVLAILIEILGGLALLFGFYTRWAAGVLAVLILVAFVTTFKIGDAPHFIGVLREITVMNTGGSNTAVNWAYFGALLSLVLSGSRVAAVKPDF